MNNKKTTQHLVSALLVISIALNMPSFSPIMASTSKQTADKSTAPAFSAKAENAAFQYAASQSFNEYTEHSVVANSSFIGTKTPPNTQYTVSGRMWLFVTAYSSTPDQTDDSPFITASGAMVRDGIIAANFLPMGTKVRFPTLYGDKIFVVEDRMNKRYYYKADIWMPTRWQAKQFGLRNVPIEILREV